MTKPVLEEMQPTDYSEELTRTNKCHSTNLSQDSNITGNEIC